MSRFDQSARHLARLDPPGFLAWLLTDFGKYLRFRRWLGERTTPAPGDTETTADTVAELESLDNPQSPWLFPIEFQTEPDPDMFGRFGREAHQLWLDHRPDDLPGSRYQLSGGVVNLTGTRGSAPASRVYTFPGPDRLGWGINIRERWFAEESADGTLGRIEREEVSLVILAFIPLMQAGGEDGIIQRWLAAASTRLGERDRVLIGSHTLVLAELTNWFEGWQDALKGWNMRESKVVAGWIDEGREEGRIQEAQTLLRELLNDRFGPLSAELTARIAALEDLDRLRQAVRQVNRIGKPDDLQL